MFPLEGSFRVELLAQYADNIVAHEVQFGLGGLELFGCFGTKGLLALLPLCLDIGEQSGILRDMVLL
jgi:hypothetical protein